MNAQRSIPTIWLAMLLLAGEYILLGWYLAAHHVFWLVATLILILSIGIIWKKNPLLNTLTWISNQSIFLVIGLTLLFSLILAFAFIKPVLLSLSVLPSITLLYALLEMQSANFKQADILFWIVVLTGVGLGVGEGIDLFITPSMRY